MKSTVIIPNYNGIDYITDCLDSVLKNAPCEIIVVDNASTDGSFELLQSQYGEKIRLIRHKKNTGFSYAVNSGIKAAGTPYVILLNNDTIADPDFVSELEKAIESNDKIFSAGAKMISMHDHDKIDDAGDFYCALGYAFARGKGLSPEKYDKPCDIFAACAGAAIYRKELLDKEIGLFDNTHFAYLEDIDVGYRAKIHGYRNIFAPKAMVLHAGSASSGSRYNEFKTRLTSRNSVYLIYKNTPALQLILNAPFLIAGFFVKTLFFTKKGLGKTYLTGLVNGVRLCRTEKAKNKKVRFNSKNLTHYIRIQLELWANMFLLLSNAK